MTGLPDGWASGPLSDFIEPRGEKASPSDFPDMPFIGMDHVEPHTTKIVGYVPSRQMKSSASRFYQNDVLYGRLRPYLNKVAQPGFDGLASGEFIVFEGNARMEPSFLCYRLHARDFVSFASHLNEGDRPRVNFKQIGEFRVLVPPREEQRRIVKKIEALFDEIDRGIESLRVAKKGIEQYRQSLLKAAFEGRLTADWRSRNLGRTESGKALFARIRRQREQSYQTALVNWRDAIALWHSSGDKGKKPPKPKKPREYPPELVDLQIALPQLPSNWIWSHLGWCSTGPEYGTSAKSSEQGDIPVIRMGNLQDGRIDWENLVYTSNRTEIERYSLNAGDVLFNRTNSPELVGKSAIYRGERKALFAGYLVRVNQIADIAFGPYIAYFLNSSVARKHGNAVKTDGVNQSNINGTKLQHYPFPFCPIAEQVEIVRILDDRLGAAESLKEEIDTNLALADAFRQSVLNQAFSGKLVLQDPCDEPAALLLKRMKAKNA